MKPKKLLQLNAALTVSAPKQEINISSSKSCVRISFTSFAFLKQSPISKRIAFGLAKQGSKHLKQELQLMKQKRMFLSFSRGKFRVHHWGLALKALLV